MMVDGVYKNTVKKLLQEPSQSVPLKRHRVNNFQECEDHHQLAVDESCEEKVKENMMISALNNLIKDEPAAVNSKLNSVIKDHTYIKDTMCYKWCVVPGCGNNTYKTPEKLFIYIPRSPKIRQKWLKLARLNPKSILPKSNHHFCEDHFDLKKDMQNYYRYQMGLSRMILLRKGALPSKFHCQEDLSKKICKVSYPRFPYIKRRRLNKFQECEDYVQLTMNESCINKMESSINSALNNLFRDESESVNSEDVASVDFNDEENIQENFSSETSNDNAVLPDKEEKIRVNCLVCDYQTDSFLNLKNHIRIHEVENSFSSDFCDDRKRIKNANPRITTYQ